MRAIARAAAGAAIPARRRLRDSRLETHDSPCGQPARRSGGALVDGLSPERRLPTAVEPERVRGITHDFIKMGRALNEAGAGRQAAVDALERSWIP